MVNIIVRNTDSFEAHNDAELSNNLPNIFKNYEKCDYLKMGI